ncbi:MAG: cysteine methyltransferase [Intrasporangiaceae bacterium]|nr:cysteine methyltransferase [Intrasporangiaceae bacterium]
MDEVVVERVLRAVEQVPRGRLVAYGDIARTVGIGARQVGWIMRHWGSNVPWWRVVNASGQLPEHLVDEAHTLWAQEGIVPSGRGVSLSDYRADLAQLTIDWERACLDLSAD